MLCCASVGPEEEWTVAFHGTVLAAPNTRKKWCGSGSLLSCIPPTVPLLCCCLESSSTACTHALTFCPPSFFPAVAVGDTALGYDLAKANLVHMDYEAHVNRGGAVPDVILVRKSYEEKRRKHKGKGGGRAWKLKHLDIEMGDER